MKNIILKQTIDFDIQYSIEYFRIRNEISELNNNVLLPGIEKLFDEKVNTDKIIRIDKIEIDAGNIDFKDWKNEFIKRVLEKLSIELDDVSRHEIDFAQKKEIITKEQSIEQIILYFIEHGTLPWFAITNLQEINENLMKLFEKKEIVFISKLIELIKKNEIVIDRLIYQFEEKQLELILDLIIKSKEQKQILHTWKKILSDIKFNERLRKYICYKTFLQSGFIEGEEIFMKTISDKIFYQLEEEKRAELVKLISDEKYIKEQLKEIDIKLIRNVLEHLSAKESSTASKEEKPETKVILKKENEWYIKNSGLVILHPFLPALFENTGYLKNNEWVSEESQQRAISLTQFMSTGIEEYPEFDLLLNKIICGYDIEKSLPFDIKLSEFEKNEANDLLISVIKHWSILKNTSVEGLRESFLQREGKLTFKDYEWFLQVEQKPYDMLLQHLPWNINMIKLSWMESLLKVEWI